MPKSWYTLVLTLPCVSTWAGKDKSGVSKRVTKCGRRRRRFFPFRNLPDELVSVQNKCFSLASCAEMLLYITPHLRRLSSCNKWHTMVYYCWCCAVTWVTWSPHTFFSSYDLSNYNCKVTKRDLFQLLLSLTLSCPRLFFMCWWTEPRANENVDILVFPLTACTFNNTKELGFDWLFWPNFAFCVFKPTRRHTATGWQKSNIFLWTVKFITQSSLHCSNIYLFPTTIFKSVLNY